LHNSKEKKILILGATGLVGSNLYNFLKEQKLQVYGTYFKNKKKNHFKFDVFKDKLDKLKIINEITHIIFAFAINKKLDDVERNFKIENKFNYKKTIALLSECNKKKK